MNLSFVAADARGVLAAYAYDNANRVTQVAYSKSGFPTETHALEFPRFSGHLRLLHMC